MGTTRLGRGYATTIAAVLASAIGTAFGAQAQAATFTVSTTSDSGPGSLRAAVAAANSTPGQDSITAAAVGGTIRLQTGELALTDDVTITGPGASSLAVSGNNSSRVFSIAPTVTAAIAGLTISDGRVAGSIGAGGSATGGSGGPGGDANSVGSTGGNGGGGGNASVSGGDQAPVGGAGIRNEGTLTLAFVALTDNTVIGGRGGDVSATGGAGASGGDATAVNATGGRGGDGGDASATGGAGSEARGGAVYNGGNLTVLSSTISGNSADGGRGGDATAQSGAGGDGGDATASGATGGPGGSGGEAFAAGGAGGDGVGAGIYNAGSLTVRNSTISGNSSRDGGGGTVSETQGTSGAPGTASGGGTAGGAGPPGSATAVSQAGAGRGAGVHNATGGTALIESSTLVVNRAVFGANLSGGGATTLRNTIVADPRGGNDCASPVTSQGHNLESGTSCGLTQASDLQNRDPLLGVLKNNGGPTETHRLLRGSPAIDAGRSFGLTADQRGSARPSDFTFIPNAAGGNGADIGAVELLAPPPGRCGGRRATITGTGRADEIRGTPRRDVIAAGAGRDIISGLGGNDLICSGTGSDWVAGKGGRDTIRAGAGNDLAEGGAGRDRLAGQAGADRLFGGAGPDVLNGGRGRDDCAGGPGRDKLRSC